MKHFLTPLAGLLALVWAAGLASVPTVAHAQLALPFTTCPASALYQDNGSAASPAMTTKGAICTNAAGGGGGGASTIADGADVTQGAIADAACATDNGNCSVTALLKRNNQRMTTTITTLGTPMQATGGTVGLVAGVAVIGHVIADTGSTTAVTGNVTAVQATGTNLHAVLDTTSTTAVTQATGSNLHVVVDTAPSTAVTNAGTFAVQATPVTQADTFMLGGVNVKEINAITPLMGNGVTGTGSQRVTISSDNTAFSVNAVQSGTWNVGTVTTLPALPANQSVNDAQINGVAPLMGNGISGTGSQRVNIASDNTAFSVNAVQSGTWTVQPGNTANTTAWKVDGSAVTQPVNGTVSITANSAVNTAQINGVTPLMGNGISGTGVQRVTLASDGTGQVTLATGAATIGALTANQSVNTAQVNGITPLMGNGVTGTGSQRVTIASDNTAFAVNGTLQTQTDTIMVGGTNVKEINAVTPLMGNGVTGTGSLRVTIASDNTSNSNAFLVNGNTTAADAATLTNGLRTNSLGMVYNGATADMAREASNGMNSVGTGIPIHAMSAQFDDTSPVAPTENQWINLRANIDHSLLVNTPSFLPNSTSGIAAMETATSGNVANAAAAATLATAANRTTMITGLHMTAAGATAAAAVNCTITGVITGTQTFTFVFSTLNAYTQRDIYFNPPLPASTTNTTIVASCPAGGTGAANASMNLEGILF